MLSWNKQGMSNIGRVVVAKTSNAEYIVGVNGVENIVSFEPGGRKQKCALWPPVVSFGIKKEIARDWLILDSPLQRKP